MRWHSAVFTTIMTALIAVHAPARSCQSGAPSTSHPHIDSSAMAILKRNERKMQSLRTFQAECRTTITFRSTPPEKRVSSLSPERSFSFHLLMHGGAAIMRHAGNPPA